MKCRVSDVHSVLVLPLLLQNPLVTFPRFVLLSICKTGTPTVSIFSLLKQNVCHRRLRGERLVLLRCLSPPRQPGRGSEEQFRHGSVPGSREKELQPSRLLYPFISQEPVGWWHAYSGWLFFLISYPVGMSSIEFYLECLSDSNLDILIMKSIAYNLLIVTPSLWGNIVRISWK